MYGGKYSYGSYYDEFEWSEDNHHPTCRCGCGQLADECAGPRWQNFLKAEKAKQSKEKKNV